MTAWTEYSEADFDAKRAPAHVRRNAGKGQAPLFAAGTPVVPAKPAPKAPEMDGQGGLFGTGPEDVSGAWDGFQVVSDADPGL